LIHHNGYVPYGCGLCAPDSWTNFDASPPLRIQSWPVIGWLLTRGGPGIPAGVRFGDSPKPRLADVEDSGRCDNALGMKCRSARRGD
jgi:hypothetical protein